MVRKPGPLKVHAYFPAKDGEGFISMCRKVRRANPKMGDLITCKDCKKALDKLEI